MSTKDATPRQRTPKLKPAAKLYTHRQVAAMVSIDTETLRKWVARGEWPEPTSIVVRTWFYPVAAVDQYIASGEWPDGMRFKAGEGKGRVTPHA